MRTLILVRHAKAEPMGRGDDFDRPLTASGITDAGRLGTYLARVGHVPELALVSSAKRTMQTFDRLARRVGAPVPVDHSESLYNATAAELRGLVAKAESDIERLMIVGHNPGIMDAAVGLTSDGDLEELGRMRGRFPPCSAAILTFAGEDWRDVATGGGRLETFVMAEDLVS